MTSLKKRLTPELMKPVCVGFDDPTSIQGWIDLKDAVKDTETGGNKAYGILIAITHTRIAIAHISDGGDQVADIFWIPKKAILSVKVATSWEEI